jgi:predicted HTH transcriptional regulator
MDIDHTRIQELVERLAESLNVEVKNWISPDDPNEATKIVRAVFALRNRNGGYLVIGFDDKTLQPDTSHRPSDVKGQFHSDIELARFLRADRFGSDDQHCSRR